eukprot:m.141828 g.141828  ORF g.141828 m.141828 type:complete len:355 (+) comp22885_c0_seq1:2543-3607(+)
MPCPLIYTRNFTHFRAGAPITLTFPGRFCDSSLSLIDFIASFSCEVASFVVRKLWSAVLAAFPFLVDPGVILIRYLYAKTTLIGAHTGTANVITSSDRGHPVSASRNVMPSRSLSSSVWIFSDSRMRRISSASSASAFDRIVSSFLAKASVCSSSVQSTCFSNGLVIMPSPIRSIASCGRSSPCAPIALMCLLPIVPSALRCLRFSRFDSLPSVFPDERISIASSRSSSSWSAYFVLILACFPRCPRLLWMGVAPADAVRVTAGAAGAVLCSRGGRGGALEDFSGSLGPARPASFRRCFRASRFSLADRAAPALPELSVLSAWSPSSLSSLPFSVKTETVALDAEKLTRMEASG